MLEYTSHADVAQGFARARYERAQVFGGMLSWLFRRDRIASRTRAFSRWA